MLNKEGLRRALNELDVRRIRGFLKSGSAGPDDAKELIDLVKHTGCLIDHYGISKNREARLLLVDTVVDFISDESSDCLEAFKFHVDEAAILTLIFRKVKQKVRDLDVSSLSPGQQAWSVIDWAASHLSILHEKSMKPPLKIPILYRAGASNIDNGDGKPIDGDEVIEGTEQYLRMALCMLAHENGWWANDGKLTLPPKLFSKKEDTSKAGGHIYLASIWDLVSNSSETLRFWGNGINLGKISIGDDSTQTMSALLFDLNFDTRLYFTIAKMRMIQIEIDIHMAQIAEELPPFKDPAKDQIAMPPNDFVSFDELGAAVLLDMLYHYDFENDVRVGGLSPAKLIRGYAVLKRYFEKPFESIQMSTVLLDKKKVTQALTNSSLTEEEAMSFLKSVTFGRKSRDFFDCPIVRSASGDEHLLQGFLQFASLPRIAVSRLSSLRVEFKNKGTTFERQVEKIFLENEIPATGFTFWVGSEEFQFDVVAVWRDFVFIFECKNYLLPPPSAAQEFYFMNSMDEAIDQVIRLKSALENNPSELSRHFAVVPTAPIFVPVTLNAMPFSMDIQRRGVFLYDYSALTRFFDGTISINQPIWTENKWIRVEYLIKRLWAGSSPEPTDLINQMKNPTQIEVEMARWHVDQVTLGLTDRLAMRIPVLRKEDTSAADMLKALKIDDVVAELVNKISSGLHQRLGTRRKSKKPKK